MTSRTAASQLNQQKEYKRLFEKYNKMSNEELSEITKPESEYTELAVKVASDILRSDRTKYFQQIKLEQQREEEKQEIKMQVVRLVKPINVMKVILKCNVS